MNEQDSYFGLFFVLFFKPECALRISVHDVILSIIDTQKLL